MTSKRRSKQRPDDAGTTGVAGGGSTSAEPAPRLRPLRDRRDCARYVAGLIRAAHKGAMPVDRAKSLCWMAQVLADLLEGVDLQARLDALEMQMNDHA